MAKFKFSLKSVEKYRNITLDEAKGKYAKAVADVNTQNELIAKVVAELTEVNHELNRRNSEGITILEYQGYKRYIKILETRIQEEEEKLYGLRNIEHRRHREMIVAKTDVMSIEKLREKNFEEFTKEETKKEELAIDEFVSNQVLGR
ncbi:flagellar export protein FliJ [Clostridium aminobutyricum]|uniref:Flagellar FliJ protein n=1 Tax=Clostridium aminobutyricum TaxID=33953 RepID=A0A939DAJ5_CLOAM|nr:flagellar export protein FliJ [Clostridium aminobutyricum]MBN7773768.1 flagellar export protein FliJ [Clostridium aminobutyricum]